MALSPDASFAWGATKITPDGKTGANRTRFADQGLQGVHRDSETWFGRCRQVNSMRARL